MKTPEIWIMPSGRQWLIVEQGQPGNLGFFVSQAKALDRGRQIARERQGLLYVREGLGWRSVSLTSRPEVAEEKPSSVEIWVYPMAEGEWGIKLPTRAMPFGIHLSRSSAVEAGRSLAAELNCDLMIFGAEGHVESRESHRPISKEGL